MKASSKKTILNTFYGKKAVHAYGDRMAQFTGKAIKVHDGVIVYLPGVHLKDVQEEVQE
jgi:hypothetical protein